MKGIRTINIDVDIWDKFTQMFPRRASEMINDYIIDMTNAQDEDFSVEDELIKTEELERELFIKKQRLLAIQKEKQSQLKISQEKEDQEETKKTVEYRDYWADLSDHDKIGVKYRCLKYNKDNNTTLSDFDFFRMEMEK